MASAIHRFFDPPAQRNIPLVISASVATTLAVVAAGKLIYQNNQGKVIVSPRTTLLPRLSEAEQADLAYPPDTFPGARDVVSPVCYLEF